MDATAHHAAGTQIPCLVFPSSVAAARHAARTIAQVIRQRNAGGEPAVVGLAAHSCLVGVYRELVRMHRDEGLDFSGTQAFVVGEYYGLRPDQLQSFRRWMSRTFFDHVNVPPDGIHVLDGAVPPEDVPEHCRQFEVRLRRAGRIHVQLLGIGRNGSLGFNEPFGVRHSRTRLVTLDPVTRRAIASDFFQEENVPTQALTMGIGMIFDAEKILVVAFGEELSGIVRESAEGPVTDRVPASFLQEHRGTQFLLDEAAAEELTELATPWVLGNVAWTDELTKRAVLWLCQRTGKALLKLDDRDFRDHDLHQLLRDSGPAPKLAHRVFRWMMETIEYHPAGRRPQRVLCFSPHPDDDVISMGGTLIRLVEDQHEVHVAYMTSGNIAVFDHDARRIVDLFAEINRRFGIDVERSPELERRVLKALENKHPADADAGDVLKIKELIRWSEAKAAALVCGCREENLHFLDLPFYRTGTIDKRAPGPDDVAEVRRCIDEVQPGQVYVAGDLSDPHGTHRVCAQLTFEALGQIDKETGRRPEVLLYRGAWQEWAPHRIDIAVPLSPRDLERKKSAIFRHESQKDSALFPGAEDPREFWQRAEERNRHTADLYNQIGLPEYYALEAFVRWDGRTL